MADGIDYLLWRHELDDGRVTTLYAVRHPIAATKAGSWLTTMSAPS